MASSASPQAPSISSWLPLSPLGSGSFGHVSLALNLLDGSLFAAKSVASSSSPQLLALLNELHILQSLHSPSILQCLGADFSPVLSPHPPLCNLFLEYMDGGSLTDVLKQSGGKFREEAHVRRFTHSILQGLDYLHQNGVVHCDIKSQNILIGSSGVKIADFGAARRIGEASPVDGNLRGTPLWMAPEVAQGVEPMPSADIWSLGCTVVEMLQGRPPWGHVRSLAAALFKVGCSKENPPLPESISTEARDFLMKCLQRDPKSRWTAAELLNHAFVCNLEEAEPDYIRSKRDQPSPRSTLDFLHSDGESDWEEESAVGSVPTLCFPTIKACRRLTEACECARADAGSLTQASDWITVKSREGWAEKRQAPFMQGGRGGGAGEVLQVRRDSEVSLEAAEFLKNRVNVHVG